MSKTAFRSLHGGAYAGEPVARPEVAGEDLTVLPIPYEPAVLGRGVDLLAPVAARQRDAHERLDAEGVERRVVPLGVAADDAVDAARELPDRAEAVAGEHEGLAGQAVPEAVGDVERR